jgi:hypothetical protein
MLCPNMFRGSQQVDNLLPDVSIDNRPQCAVSPSANSTLHFITCDINGDIWYASVDWQDIQPITKLAWTNWGEGYSPSGLPAVGYSASSTYVFVPADSGKGINYRSSGDDYSKWHSLAGITGTGPALAVSRLTDNVWDGGTPLQTAVFYNSNEWPSLQYQYQVSPTDGFNGKWLPAGTSVDSGMQTMGTAPCGNDTNWIFYLGNGQVFYTDYSFLDNTFTAPVQLPPGLLTGVSGCVVPCGQKSPATALVVFTPVNIQSVSILTDVAAVTLEGSRSNSGELAPNVR